jgi:hypothetical protein
MLDTQPRSRLVSMEMQPQPMAQGPQTDKPQDDIMLIARVFPRRTKATPIDDLAFVDVPGLFPPEVDEVHISVSFTYDLPKAEWLAKQWDHIASVRMGGPAFGYPSGEFIPGRYLKPGYVITSRGCPNHCWFCSVWKRESSLIELPIYDGWNLLDDNILACSESHVRKVFAMLKRQRHKAEFTGGLEAAILKHWHVSLLADLRPSQMFFAYDTEDDLEPLIEASRMLKEVGFTRNQMRCYVLIGYPKDTISSAEKRLKKCVDLGFAPAAMLWKDDNGKSSYIWKRFQREWIRPAIIYRKRINRRMMP